jgi:hypothetical protein
MDVEFERGWRKLIERLESQFGEELELEGRVSGGLKKTKNSI